MDDARLLKEQIEYYRARANEYDEWAFRRGRYDRGPHHRAVWLAEVAAVERALGDGLLFVAPTACAVRCRLFWLLAVSRSDRAVRRVLENTPRRAHARGRCVL